MNFRAGKTCVFWPKFQAPWGGLDLVDPAVLLETLELVLPLLLLIMQVCASINLDNFCAVKTEVF